MRILRFALLALCVAFAGVAADRPRLLVVVSVDQLSADLVARWGKDLPGGLGRLLREGTHFRAAYHEHGYTETGPGHSVLLSGRHTGHTGITENNWYDAASGKWVYCVGDPGVQTLGAEHKKESSSPRWFKGSTLAGWLKQQVPGSRFFTVSGKDRSAILMTGPTADAVYWFEGGAGFTTSTAYARSLPPWLVAHNRAFNAGLGNASVVWTALDPAEPGNTPVRYELPGRTVALGLPRLIKGVGMPMDDGFWDRFRPSPLFDEAILGTAEALLEAEGLGRPGRTDVLAVGLSATDYIGHRFGNAGPEMRDQVRRLDRRLGAFLAKVLARDPGAWVVLAADHGCTDFCERLQQQGIPAQRGSWKEWLPRVEAQLAAKLGLPGPFLNTKVGCLQFWLREEALKPAGRNRQEILAAAIAVLRAQPEVAGAWSREELLALPLDPAADPGKRTVPERIKLSLDPGRAGDILLAFAPFFTFDQPPDLATHGSPWDYDRRIPLVFWGPWTPETRNEPVRTIDLAPTLAKELGITPAEPVDGRALALHPKSAAQRH
jgi:predicted AlkP superfamily pyrophosphatase or phosphodiesterase